MPRPPSIIPFVPRSSFEGGVRSSGAPLPIIWQTYMEIQLPRRSKSYQDTARHVRHLSSSLGDHPSVENVQRWYQGLRVGERTRKLYADHLQRVFSWGADAGLCQGNPVKLAEFKKPVPQPRAIRDIGRAWPQLLAAMETDRERLYVGVLRFTGCRKQEALGLTREDVIGKRDLYLAFRQQRQSNGWATGPLKAREKSNRMIPVRRELKPLLLRVLGLPDPLVRMGKGGHHLQQVNFLMPFLDYQLGRMMARIRLALPLHFPAGDAWHVLRHSLAYEMATKGVRADVNDIKAVLGHTNIRTTDAYLTGLVGRKLRKEVFEGQ